MMFLAYVMRRAGTFSMEEKVKMIEFLNYMALNPNRAVNPSIANLPFLSSASGVNAPIFSDTEIFSCEQRRECQCSDDTSRSDRRTLGSSIC